ncbi:hypothetical protein PV332_23080 [Streptomyces scabiei]|nr:MULTISPECIES: hypothetical protein [Streptomyces]MDX2532580.1 hypothetical protein [Streptomyces scabiei]MDX2578338.1 hypothetical protein [Streptomyces scabiei]MDX2657650.1 hypothetical protein [Streptomyces scabiei]MDX2690220.1 hypothetical protein [Streptomyces scabiei]MDX2723952.1 hypothetical protein [Streptomyces scabiei]
MIGTDVSGITDERAAARLRQALDDYRATYRPEFVAEYAQQ